MVLIRHLVLPKRSLDGARNIRGNALIVAFKPLKNLIVTLFRSHALGNSGGPEMFNRQVDTI